MSHKIIKFLIIILIGCSVNQQHEQVGQVKFVKVLVRITKYIGKYLDNLPINKTADEIIDFILDNAPKYAKKTKEDIDELLKSFSNNNKIIDEYREEFFEKLKFKITKDENIDVKEFKIDKFNTPENKYFEIKKQIEEYEKEHDELSKTIQPMIDRWDHMAKNKESLTDEQLPEFIAYDEFLNYKEYNKKGVVITKIKIPDEMKKLENGLTKLKENFDTIDKEIDSVNNVIRVEEFSSYQNVSLIDLFYNDTEAASYIANRPYIQEFMRDLKSNKLNNDDIIKKFNFNKNRRVNTSEYIEDLRDSKDYDIGYDQFKIVKSWEMKEKVRKWGQEEANPKGVVVTQVNIDLGRQDKTRAYICITSSKIIFQSITTLTGDLVQQNSYIEKVEDFCQHAA